MIVSLAESKRKFGMAKMKRQRYYVKDVVTRKAREFVKCNCKLHFS